MVKRTVLVLSILSLIVMAAGTSMAQLPLLGGGMGECFGGSDCLMPKPLYVPVDCPAPIQRTIKKTWECKIVGPCPPPSGPAGACGVGKEDRMGLLLSLATALGTPFDWVFAGCDGVYGCVDGGAGGCTPCGSCFGGSIPRMFGNVAFMASPNGSFFGGLW